MQASPIDPLPAILDSKLGWFLRPIFLLKDSTIVQIESQVLRKCCNQEKTPWKYWTQWTFDPSKNKKIQTKTHEIDVLEAVENGTLESHSRRYCFVVFRSCSSVGQNAPFTSARSQVRVLSRPQKQAILRENEAKMPNAKACCQNLKGPPRRSGRRFLFKSARCCKSVAIRIDSRTQSFQSRCL